MTAPTFQFPAGPDQAMDDLIAAYATAGTTRTTDAPAPVPVQLRLNAWAPTANACVLPPAATAVRGVKAALTERRDVRSFAPDALPARVLTAVLSRMTGQDRSLASGEAEAGNALVPFVLVRRVSNVEAGIYASAPSGDRLDRQAPLAADQWRARSNDVRLLGAAAVILVVGSPAAAWHRGGARGHLQLVRRAGSVTYAGWLAALEQGCDGCILEAPAPSVLLREALGLDPASRRPLLALAVGVREPTSD